MKRQSTQERDRGLAAYFSLYASVVNRIAMRIATQHNRLCVWLSKCVNSLNELFTFSPASQTRQHAYKLFKSWCVRTTRPPSTANFTSLAGFQRAIFDVDFSEYRKY